MIGTDNIITTLDQKLLSRLKLSFNKLRDFIRYKYLKFIKFRLIRLNAIMQHLKNKAGKESIVFEINPSTHELTELDFTMEIIKKNVELYFESNDVEERKKIFNSFFNSVQKHDNI